MMVLVKRNIEKGRGHAAGKGKQAGLGQSGQNKRGGTRPGFEGGQNPWYRRIGKRGFTNINQVTYEIVSLDKLESKFQNGDIVTYDKLKALKLANRNLPIKVLNKGKLTKQLTLKVNAISKSARTIVENLKGKVEII